MRISSDLIGIGSSILCAFHCLALPLVVSSLPIAGINLVENRWLEYGLIFIALIAGLLSFYSGSFKKHKIKKPLLVFIAGFAFLLLNQVNENAFFILGASLFIISAHLWNHRLSKKHKTCLKLSNL